MKTSLTLTLVGAACALLSSCGIHGRQAVYVTSQEGEPIAGARIVPCATPKGCHEEIVTDACGKARLPKDAGAYSVEKAYFRPAKGLKSADHPQHVVMVPGWPN